MTQCTSETQVPGLTVVFHNSESQVKLFFSTYSYDSSSSNILSAQARRTGGKASQEQVLGDAASYMGAVSPNT